MQTNNFQELIKEYEAHCQNTSTQEYTDILYELSFSTSLPFSNANVTLNMR